MDDIAVDASYDGPHLRDKTVDESFALALLDHFKAQKVLHRKYAYQILLQIKEFFEQQPTMVDVTVDAGDKFTVRKKENMKKEKRKKKKEMSYA